ncbi:MAG: PilZ domain-containing protein [Sphingorhabdus sp.]
MVQPAIDQNYDMRRAARHRASYHVLAESKPHGEQKLHIANVSAHGFMIDNNEVFRHGDRIELRLPVIGRIEAHLIWSVENRAGFQFERVIRLPDFMALIDKIGPKIR